MQIAIQVAAIGKQGRPAFGIGNREQPDSVDVNLPKDATRGEVMYATQELFSVHGGEGDRRPKGGTMSRSLELSLGTEAHQSKYKAKWTEPNPLAGRSDGVMFASTSVPRETLGKVTISAYDLDKQHEHVGGARRLIDILDWLEFCMVPWTELGTPPLLHVTVGVRSFYGYIEDFDPQITEWLHDKTEDGAGLPSEAAFSLSFIREPDPESVFKKKDLPSTNYKILGGAGGLTGGLVTAKGLESGHAAEFKAFERSQKYGAQAAADAAKKELLINPALRAGFKLAVKDAAAASTPAGTSTSAGASNNPATRKPGTPPPAKTTPLNPRSKVPQLAPALVSVTVTSASAQQLAAARGNPLLGQGITRAATFSVTPTGGGPAAGTAFTVPNGVPVFTVRRSPDSYLPPGTDDRLPVGPTKQELLARGVPAVRLENYVRFDPDDRSTWPTPRFR